MEDEATTTSEEESISDEASSSSSLFEDISHSTMSVVCLSRLKEKRGYI